MIVFQKKNILKVSLIYIYVPIIIFLIGWTKPYIALFSCAALLFGGVKLYQEYMTKNPDNTISIDYYSFILILCFLLIIGCCAGWGRFTSQSGDWDKHNTILKDLINRSWPVYYHNGDEHSMLTYYLGQYMVPALFGKICGSFRLAELINLVWAEIGLFLIYINLIRILQIKTWYMQWITAGMLAFFNCPLILAQKIMSLFYRTWLDPSGLTSNQWFIYLPDNNILLQYSSHFTLLRWVFPQVLVMWLVILLFYEHRDMIQHYIMLMLPSAFFGILSFAGLLPFAISYAFYELYISKNIKKCLAQVFSPQNCLSFLTFGTILILYYQGNVLSKKPESLAFKRIDYENVVLIYIIFVGIMILLYGLLILKANYKNVLFHIATLVLLILPLFTMGLYNDFGMRCSIPALFFYFLFTLQFLNQHIGGNLFTCKNISARWDKLCMSGLTVLLCIGTLSPLREFTEVIVSDDWLTSGPERISESMEEYASRYLIDMQQDLIYNYYSYDIEDNIFYRYIARKKM